jgi:hypothetical protein
VRAKIGLCINVFNFNQLAHSPILILSINLGINVASRFPNHTRKLTFHYCLDSKIIDLNEDILKQFDCLVKQHLCIKNDMKYPVLMTLKQ